MFAILASDHVRTPPSLHFLCSKFSIFLTTYPPLNANVICEGCLTWTRVKIYKHPSAPSISTTEVTLTVQHADRARANFMWRKRLLWFRRRKLISQFSFRAPPWRSHTYILLQTVCKLYVLEVTYYVLSLKWSDNCSINIC